MRDSRKEQCFRRVAQEKLLERDSECEMLVSTPVCHHTEWSVPG
jgi:hypothetical protein